jgi:hypothetical protein
MLRPAGSQELLIKLKRKAVPVAVGRPEPPPSRPTRPEPEVAVKSGAPGQGTLSLSVQPPCEIFVDGRNLGMSPASGSVSAGDVTVQLVNKELGINQWIQVRVPPNGKAEKSLTLGKGKVAADVQPWADVYIGEKKLGTTPLAPRELWEGTYLVRLVNSEIGAIKTVNVVIKPGQTFVIRQNLQ